jgi:citrate lyase beta subunit
MTPRKQPSIKPSLSPRDLKPIVAGLHRANAAFARACPGETGDRQPVHTVYGGAHLFRADTSARLGALAIAALEEFAPDAPAFATATGVDDGGGDVAIRIYERMLAKLRREPVEDFRIDFEDGYGNRPDAEEDGHAASAAREVAAGLRDGTLPPFIGIRIKPLSPELHARSLRTLDIFVSTLASETRKRLPPAFIVTIPKVTMGEHVAAVVRSCVLLEKRLGLRAGAIRVELMIETPQSVLSIDGRAGLRRLIAAGGGRISGAHFGTYDYTALCGITAEHQHMMHAVCDFAKHVMQVSLAQTGIQISDGATNIMPVAPHRASAGQPLTNAERQENRAAVHRAWKLHASHVRHSLVNGFYQGWDLHPAQLPTRFAAVYAFFLSALPAASARLKNFVEKAAQATLVGDVFDDAATGQGLLNFFVRGLNCGAITPEEAAATGLTHEELQGRSFLKILEARRRSG